MDIGIGALLFGAGLAGGVANAMAGGATLITFPAMIASGAWRFTTIGPCSNS